MPIGVFSVVDKTTSNLTEFSTIVATASLIVESAAMACAGSASILGDLIVRDLVPADQPNRVGRQTTKGNCW